MATRLPLGHQLGDVALGGVVRHATHGDAVALGEGHVEQRGCGLGVFKEKLVEVAQSKEQQHVLRQLSPHGEVLLHHRGGGWRRTSEPAIMGGNPGLSSAELEKGMCPLTVLLLLGPSVGLDLTKSCVYHLTEVAYRGLCLESLGAVGRVCDPAELGLAGGGGLVALPPGLDALGVEEGELELIGLL